MSRRCLVLPLSAVLAAVGALLPALGNPPSASAAQASLAEPRVAAPALQAQGRKVRVSLTAGASDAVGILARGRIMAGGRSWRLRRVVATAAPGETARLRLRPRGRRQEHRILRVLRGGRQLESRLAVRLSDLRGNAIRQVLSVLLTR